MSFKRWANILLEKASFWKRGIEPKEDHSLRAFHLGGWIHPSLTHVYLCIVERYMWGFPCCLLVWALVLTLC
jgi:hypothetical protein